MKRGVTLSLQGLLLLIATGVLAGMIRFPQTEGRAANLDLVSIYADPVIIYLYIASIPFFVAVFQAFKLLGYIGNNTVFSRPSVSAVRTIQYCALAIPVFIIAGLAFIVSNAQGDDFAGPVALGIYTSFASVMVAATAAVFRKRLQKKSHS